MVQTPPPSQPSPLKREGAEVATWAAIHLAPRPQAGLVVTWLMLFVSLVSYLVVSSEGLGSGASILKDAGYRFASV